MGQDSGSHEHCNAKPTSKRLWRNFLTPTEVVLVPTSMLLRLEGTMFCKSSLIWRLYQKWNSFKCAVKLCKLLHSSMTSRRALDNASVRCALDRERSLWRDNDYLRSTVRTRWFNNVCAIKHTVWVDSWKTIWGCWVVFKRCSILRRLSAFF